MEVTLAVGRNRLDHALGDAVVGFRKRQRRGLAKAVVLEAGQRTRGGLGRRAVDHLGLDAPVVGAQPEVDVGRRDHRVAGRQEDSVTVRGGLENGFGPLLDTLAVADNDVDVVGGLEVVDGRPDEAAGVELGEGGVGRPERVATPDGNRALVVEAETDEREHTGRGCRAGKTSLLCLAGAHRTLPGWPTLLRGRLVAGGRPLPSRGGPGPAGEKPFLDVRTRHHALVAATEPVVAVIRDEVVNGVAQADWNHSKGAEQAIDPAEVTAGSDDGVGFRVELGSLDEHDRVEGLALVAGRRQNFLGHRRLEGGEAEFRVGVTLDDELNPAVAEVADAVEEEDRPVRGQGDRPLAASPVVRVAVGALGRLPGTDFGCFSRLFDVCHRLPLGGAAGSGFPLW